MQEGAGDGSDVRARAPDAGGRRREGKMPVAVMAESSVSFRRLLEQCETQELEVPRGGGVCVCACEGGSVRGRVCERGRVQCLNLPLGLASEPVRNSQPADK